MKFSTLGLAFAIGATAAASLPAINITGNAFFNSETGERFYIRGVDYQPGGSSNLTDPLGDSTICGRDIPYFEELGLNTIRVYSVDNTLDHSECMQMLDDAGIYLILDLNTPDASISRYDPGCSYNAVYLNEVFSTVDEFSNYTNILGFFAANELVNNNASLDTAPYIKAVVRDTKKYIKARGYRQIPVGYSAADVSSLRKELADYLNCGNDTDAKIDMLGVNDYSWCGQSSFTTSGYSEKVEMYTGFSVPIFLSEYGCNQVPGSRPFTEVKSIYSTQMSPVFSGGLVYQYTEDSSKYGLVEIEGDSVETLTDFENLKDELNLTSDPIGDGDYSATGEESACPTDWAFSINIPTAPDGLSKLLKNGATGGNGFDAETQNSCGDDAYYVSSTITANSSSMEHTSSSTASSAHSTSTKSSSSSSKGIADQLEAHGMTALLALIAIRKIYIK
ncbi:1,3-beta-glucanosyltransferase [Brettanomyces nanus]|uniref:1,3-beta-glucanosyltransferase n=1 Tax=Eeniella nana TaxID=13502 RepID=A0A875SBD3_EENNA|nr:1,3-beta-glucanosyltransferase [Brettanomyces nanus]QPG76214.1 1,3-beta-glucanosyltransferase [Brettanomyces nanus]